MQSHSFRRPLLHLGVVILIMLDTLRRFSESVAYSISMWAMELVVLALIAYEATVLFIGRRREKRILREEEEGLDNLEPVMLEEFRSFILGGPPPSEQTWAAFKKNNREIVGRDYVIGWVIMKEHKQSLKEWAKKKIKPVKFAP
jgi:hypothetical protein